MEHTTVMDKNGQLTGKPSLRFSIPKKRLLRSEIHIGGMKNGDSKDTASCWDQGHFAEGGGEG